MFLKKNKKNLRLLFTIFAVPGLAATMLWWGGNTSATNANTTKVGDDTDAPAVVFSNPTAINIPDVGPATPYPSNITVGGVGAVSSITVTLNGFTHTFPDDVDVLLVGPTGASLILMSDAGGGTDIVQGINLTFSDAAATAIPDTSGTTPLPGGTYKPANYPVAADPFPAPAPAGPYGSPAPSGTATLTSVFGGTNANGVWSLYVVDDATGDMGSFSGGWSLDITAGSTQQRGALFDFTGDGRTDWTTLTFPAASGQQITWKVLGNPANPAPNAAFIRIFNYGLLNDSVIPGDFTGDNKTEPTVYRQGPQSVFYVAQFPTGTDGITLDRAVQWGSSSAADNPNVSGDYDGDGKLDYTVVRIVNDNFVWYILSSSSNTMRAITFGTRIGARGFIRFYGADFTGDGRDELVFFTFDDARTITYYVGDAVTGAGVITRNWGNFNTDISVSPADYTGDGRADFVAVRQTTATATWYINNSATNAVTATSFGISDPGFSNNDRPVRGDYDGDRKHDIAVWRPSNQTFYVLRSIDGGITGQKWGDAGDVPLGATGTF